MSNRHLFEAGQATTLLSAVALVAGLSFPANATPSPAGNLPSTTPSLTTLSPSTTSSLTPAFSPTNVRLMHRDMNSSDTLPWAGPGNNPSVTFSIPFGACSTAFQTSTKMTIALCTKYVGLQHGITPIAPTVVLMDPRTAQPLATWELHKNGLLGGVYGYLDEQDRVVMTEGNKLLKIAFRAVGRPSTNRHWEFYVAESTTIPGLPETVSIAGVIPDGAGNTWFSTSTALVGSITPTGKVRTLQLGKGERVANGLTPRPNGVSVLTTHKLWEISGPVPKVKWARAYDRGRARKAGQLSWGSGTTPTFFGPHHSRVAIVDSADFTPHLLVFDAETGRTICKMPAFRAPNQGTENSIMAHGNSLWIPSTYGFTYPKLAVEGPQFPEKATFLGGLTRIDLVNDRCVRRWENMHRISTLPMLTLKDFRIWSLTTDQDSSRVWVVSVDARTGKETSRIPVGWLPFDEPMQLTGMITPDGVMWQATATRMLRIAPQ